MSGLRLWEWCGEVARGLVIAGMVLQWSPLAWAQVEVVVDYMDPAIEAGLAEIAVTDPALGRECQTVLENAQAGGPEAVAVETDLEAAVEATATLEQLVADPEAVTATVAQALQTTGTSQTTVTETVTQVQGTVSEVQALLAEGATLANPRVEALLMELASTFAEAGIAQEAFGAMGGDTVAREFFSAMIEHGPDVFAAAIETHVTAEMREALASGGAPPSPEQMREYMEMASVAGVNFEGVMTETFREHFAGGQEMGFGPGGTMDFEAMAAAGIISQTDLETIQAGFQAMEQGFEQMHTEMMAAAEQYGGTAGFEASFAGQFETMAIEMGAQGMTPEQIGAAIEHYAADVASNAADAAASHYSTTSDTSAAGSSGYVAPSGGGGGGTEGPHTLVIDNPDPTMPDTWDGNDSDNVGDHTHLNGTAPHSGT